MLQQKESDFEPGHPGRSDYNPASPEAQEWVRKNVHPLGERDFPVDHPAAADTPGSLNSIQWVAGVDPLNPEREAFTGRSPEQAAAVRELSERASKAAAESPVVPPLNAEEVAARMNAKRVEVGNDVLTDEEVRAVMAAIYAEQKAKGV